MILSGCVLNLIEIRSLILVFLRIIWMKAEIEKLELRSVFKFLTKEGNSSKTIQERIIAIYRKDAPSYFVRKFWSKQFCWSREPIKDDPRTEIPADATNSNMCQKVKTVALEDRRLKVSIIVTSVGISELIVVDILHNKLGMSNVFAIWVPRMLSPEQKLCRQQFRGSNSSPLERIPNLL